MSRQFTQQQIDDLTLPFEEHALDALLAEDLDSVRSWLDRMAQGHAGLDALSAHALARKMGKLRQDFGEAEARRLLEVIGQQLMKTWHAQLREGDEKDAFADLVSIYRYQGDAHLNALQETDDEVILDLAPCGSGGKLDRQGLPDRHPDWYGRWSDGISTFCQGCKACQRALNESLGEDVWTTEKGEGGHCRMRFRKRSSQGSHLFTDQELETLPKTRVQLAREKLDAGETDIEPLLRGQRKEWQPWHDFGVVWLEYFYATALDKGGADYLDEMLAQTYEPAFDAGFPRYSALSDQELLEEVAKTWNYHCADFSVTEEDDRFVFRLDPCGSGGRLFRGEMWRDMFHYGEPLSPTMAEPHNINFNRHQAPTYCTHCAASNRAQLKDGPEGSNPRFFVIDGHAQQRPGQACRQFSYKKNADRAAMDPALPAQIGIDWTSSDRAIPTRNLENK
ncbi:hypothetical protein [Marinobacter segnicrescens]|uniref:hypothetical protein n=1 Tax=Marinobacter segnicrescens TaxID=430453 RepID=UPI003A8FD113